ncbi:hypothetical protein [Emticicia sp. SJ17W-69]|uniref:hypothetical protein n=1 Tax=Emticicia sp. SJ17W-69 TaxID=3421657 RepID=UPI003EBD4350
MKNPSKLIKKYILSKFSILVVVSLLTSYLSKSLLISDTLLFNFYSDILSYEKIQALIEQGKKWEWFGYLFIPIIYGIKFSLVTLCLSLGLFFLNTSHKLKQLFELAIKAELVFIVAGLFKILWFLYIRTDYTLLDLQYFSPLSLQNIISIPKSDIWLLYPLQVTNLFEMTYWFVLAWGLKEIIQKNIGESLKIVALSYGSGLIVWVAFIVFLTLNNS